MCVWLRASNMFATWPFDGGLPSVRTLSVAPSPYTPTVHPHRTPSPYTLTVHPHRTPYPVFACVSLTIIYFTCAYTPQLFCTA